MDFMDTRTEHLTHLAVPLAASLGLVLWGVETIGASRPIVRVYVDVASPEAANAAPEQETTHDGACLPAGVDIDQCAEFSRLFGLALEVEELFTGGWVLEVSSPGLERPFFSANQLHSYVGREIDVTLAHGHALWPGRKHFRGLLVSVEEERFNLRLPLSARKEDEPEDVSISWNEVRKARLVHDFTLPARCGRKKSVTSKNAETAKTTEDASGGIA